MRRYPAAFGVIWCRSPTVPPGWGEHKSASCGPPCACTYLLLLPVYSTDICKGKRAHIGPVSCGFQHPLWGGENRKICDFTRTRQAAGSAFGATILVCNRKGISPSPCNRINNCLYGAHRRTFSFFDSRTSYVLS